MERHLFPCFIANALFLWRRNAGCSESALGDGQLHLRVLPKSSVATQLIHIPKLYTDEIHKIEGSIVVPNHSGR